MFRSKLTRAFTLATLAFAAIFTANAQAGSPPLPTQVVKTKAQRQAWTVPNGVRVVEQETKLEFLGDGTTLGGKAIGLTNQRILLEKMRRAASAARNNNVVDNAVMASPPTMTSQSGTTITTIFNLANAGSLMNQDKILVVGGVPVVTQTSYMSVKSVASTTGSNIGVTGYYANGWYVEFITDSPNVDFGFIRTASSGCMVAVSENGGPLQYVSNTPLALTGSAGGSNTGHVTIPFGSSKIRRIRIEVGSLQVDEAFTAAPTFALRSIVIDPSYSIWKPKDVDAINVAFIGDSYTAQCPRDQSMQARNWARTVAAKLGWRATLMAQGGTGYSKANGALPPASDPLRLADLTSQAFDVFVFALGTNDVNGNDGTATSLSDTTAKALTCFQAARAANSIAPIIVVGPWPRPSFPAQTQSDQATAVEAAFAQFNDPNSLYIPIYDDASGNWMAGTSYQGNLVSSLDISYRYIWTDKIHPVLAGHYYYGERIVLPIRDWLQSAY